jgi:hypothetical protein
VLLKDVEDEGENQLENLRTDVGISWQKVSVIKRSYNC